MATKPCEPAATAPQGITQYSEAPAQADTDQGGVDLQGTCLDATFRDDGMNLHLLDIQVQIQVLGQLEVHTGLQCPAKAAAVNVDPRHVQRKRW